MSVDVVQEVVSADPVDVLSGSEDGAPEGRALERSGVQVVEHHLLQDGLHLLQVPKMSGFTSTSRKDQVASKQKFSGRKTNCPRQECFVCSLSTHLHFSEDDPSLPLNLLLSKSTVLENVRQNFDH